jgi:hypothetical protein
MEPSSFLFLASRLVLNFLGVAGVHTISGILTLSGNPAIAGVSAVAKGHVSILYSVSSFSYGHGPVPERIKFKQKHNVISASNIQVFWHPHTEYSKITGNGCMNT